jgi:hypothetical protein
LNTSDIQVNDLICKFFEVFPELTEDDLPNVPMVSMDYEVSNCSDKDKVTGFSLSGYAGTGKSTVASILESRGYKLISFAGALKNVTAYLFSLDRRLLEGNTIESRQWREQPCAKWWTPRSILQKLGTNVFRSLYPDIWLHTLSSRLSGKVVITDARFINEIQLAVSKGLTPLVIKRPDVGPQSSHLLKLSISTTPLILRLTMMVILQIWNVKLSY